MVLTNLSSGQLLQYHWSVFPDNGSAVFLTGTGSSSSRNETINFQAPGHYVITLIVTSGDNPNHLNCLTSRTCAIVDIAPGPDITEPNLLGMGTADGYVIHVSPNPIQPDTSIACTGTATDLHTDLDLAQFTSLEWRITGTGGFSRRFAQADPPAISLPAGLFTVELWGRGACGKDSARHMVLIRELPAVELGSNPTTCQNAALTLTAQTTQSGLCYRWERRPVGSPTYTVLSETAQSISVPTSTTGNFQYRVTAYYCSLAGLGGCTARDSVLVTVVQSPNLDATLRDTSLCLNATLQLFPAGWGVPGSAPITWLGPGPTMISPTGLFTGSRTGTFRYRYSVSLGTCADTKDTTITVRPLPKVHIPAGQSVCYSDVFSQQLIYDQPTGIGTGSTPTWDEGPGTPDGTITPGGLFNPRGLLINHDYLIVLRFDSAGCTGLDTQTVRIKSADTATIATDHLTVCQNGAAVDLNTLNPTPTGGIWTLNGTDITAFQPSAASLGSNQVVYTINRGTPCQARDTAYIFVNPKPTVAITSPPAACVNDDSLHLAGSPGGGTWLVNNTLTPRGVLLPGNYSGSIPIQYRYQDPTTGCRDTATQSLTIRPLPVLQAIQDSMVCQGGSDSVAVINPNGTGFWTQLPSVPPLPNQPISSHNQFLAGHLGHFTYLFTLTDPVTGCRNFDTVAITVDSARIVKAGADFALCLNDSIVLTGATPPDGRYTTTPPGAIRNGNVFIGSIAGVGPHLITYTYGSGTCARSATRKATVRPLPDISAGNDLQVCVNQGLIDLNTQPGVAFNSAFGQARWDSVLGPAGIQLSRAGILAPYSAPGGYGLDTVVHLQIWLRFLLDSSGCSNADLVQVNIHPKPHADFATRVLPSVYCQDSTYSFQNLTPLVNGSIGLLYDWTFAPRTFNTQTDVRNGIAAWSDTGNKEIRLVVTSDTVGCRDTVTKTIKVVAPGTVGFRVQNGQPVYCGSDTLTFENTSNGYGTRYEWDFENDGIFVPEAADPVFFRHIFPGSSTRDTAYLVTLRAIGPCKTLEFTDTIRVRPRPHAILNLRPSTRCDSVLFVNFSNGVPTRFEYFFGDPVSAVPDSTVDPVPPQFDSSQVVHVYTNPLPIPRGITAYLVAINQCGRAVDTVQFTIPGKTNPAFFDGVPARPQCAPFTVRLHSNMAGDSVNYNEWSFGDGGHQAFVSNPIYTYQQAGRYHILFTRDDGCYRDTFGRDIVIVDPPVVRFGLQSTGHCQGDSILFENQSSPGLAYTWTVDDTVYSRSQNPPPKALTWPGMHHIRLIGLDPTSGCSSVFIDSIVIRPGYFSRARMQMRVLDSCGRLRVRFTNQSLNGDTARLVFGDGTGAFQILAPSASTEYLYPGTGPYHPYLVALGHCLPDTLSGLILQGNPVPRVQIVSVPGVNPLTDTLYLCQGTEAVRFYPADTTQGFTIHWDWNLGDALFQGAQPPPHTYPRPGRYRVLLTGITDRGCRGADTLQVRVRPLPKAIITLPTARLCQGSRQYFFGNQSTNAHHYRWIFQSLAGGRPDTLETDFTSQDYVFTGYGSYRVTLWAYNDSLPGACSDDTSAVLNILRTPNPSVILDGDTAGCPPLEVGLRYPPDSYPSSPSEGTLTWYLDGAVIYRGYNPVPGLRLANTTASDLIYTLKLVARAGGCADSLERRFTVHPGPTAAIDIRPGRIIKIDSPIATFVSNTQPPSDRWHYHWDFGDGTADSTQEEEIRHTYTQVGRYPITLTVTDPLTGCLSIAHDTLTVLLVKPVVKVAVLGHEEGSLDFCQFDTVTFLNRSKFGYVYTWKFGDSETRIVGDTARQTLVLADTGRFTVKLIATNPIGADSVLLSDSITVHGAPKAAFRLTPDFASNSSLYVIQNHFQKPLETTNLTTGAVEYLWYFGDNSDTIRAVEPNHVYSDTGYFTVSLVAISEWGCKSTAEQPTWVRRSGILTVPTAFTPRPNANPNSNNLNDYFIPKMRDVEFFHMTIYNRWGKRVYETHDPYTLGWDGHDQQGRPCRSDSYLYIISGGYDSTIQKFEGSLTLIR